MNAVLLLKLTALVHLGLTAAAVLMPLATGLWRETSRLSPFGARLFQIYYAYIVLCVVAFGLGTWFLADHLAAGTPLARAVCGFLAAFWTLRLIAAILLDVRPYLHNRWWCLGYHTTNVVFCLLPPLYAWLAVRR